MTPAQMMSIVRWKATVDSNSPYDNTTMLPIANMVKNKVAQAIVQINPNYFSETSTTATVSGQSLYAKPSDYLLFKRLDASYSNTSVGSYAPARFVTLAEMGKYGEDYYASYADTSHPLVREEGKYLNISPTPTASTAGSLFLKLWYVPLPPNFTDLASTNTIYSITGIGESFDEAMIDVLVNEIRGKQNNLTNQEVQEQNKDLLDILIPAAISQIGAVETSMPTDSHLQY